MADGPELLTRTRVSPETGQEIETVEGLSVSTTDLRSDTGADKLASILAGMRKVLRQQGFRDIEPEVHVTKNGRRVRGGGYPLVIRLDTDVSEAQQATSADELLAIYASGGQDDDSIEGDDNN